MGPNKEIILHIGRAKSGTSALQTYLTLHREDLAAEQICYPKSGCNGAAAHHAIAIACRNEPPGSPDLQAMRAAFEAEIAPFETVIVSSEAFQNVRRPENLRFFFRRPKRSLLNQVLSRSAAGPYRLSVICYIREYLEFASSSYAQKVHANGYVDTLEGYCRDHFRRPLSDLVELWRGFADETAFLYYDRSSLINQDVVEDFFQRARLMLPAPTTSDYDANPSISGNLLAFKLLVNRHDRHDMALYDAFSDLARLDPRYRGKVFITDALAVDLRAHDRGYNAQLSQMVGQVECRSFEGGNPFDPAAWPSDLERFLGHPAMTELRELPEIARASAEDAAALVSQ